VVHSVCRNRGRRGRPRRSPPCAVVECLPAQVLSVNGPWWACTPPHALARPGAPSVSPESAEPRRPHGRGPNCVIPFLCRDLSAWQGHGCNVLNISRSLGAKWIFNSSCELLKLVKCLENRRKFRKMQT
jgi:hypothetical protein